MPSGKATVYVGYLPWSATEDELVRFFRQFADVVSARVIQDRKTGLSRGYGFVELVSEEQASAMCTKLNGYHLSGRRLEVRPARAKPVHQ